MNKIQLSNYPSRYLEVDQEDYAKLNQFKWRFIKTYKGYIITNVKEKGQWTSRTIFSILFPKKGKWVNSYIYKDGNVLNVRKNNIKFSVIRKF